MSKFLLCETVVLNRTKSWSFQSRSPSAQQRTGLLRESSSIPEARSEGNDTKVLLPGMSLGVYHWRLHEVLTGVLFILGKYGDVGALFGDEMGLGKVRHTRISKEFP